MADGHTTVEGSSWSNFAGIFLAIIGLFNAIDGLVALLKKEYFNETALVYQNLEVWGWVILVIGIVQLLVGWALIGRSEVARWAALVIAVISMTVSFLVIGGYPWWALLTIVMDGIVVYGVTARWRA